MVSPVSAASRASSSFQARVRAVAVGAACVGGDEQACRLWVGGPALAGPPAADRFHCERGGVVIGAHVDPAGVRREIVDPVRDGLAQLGVGEVMDVHRHGITRRPPLAAVVLELADEFLLLGVHADHRLAGVPVITSLLVETVELGIPVRMSASLNGLGVGLKTEAFLPQQVRDGVRTDFVSGPGQLPRQRAGRLHGPPERRHRIASLVRLDQRQEGRPQPRIEICDPLAASARPPHPPQRLLSGLQLGHTLADRGLTHRGHPSDDPNTTVSQNTDLRGHQQPSLPLIQMREQHRELHGELGTDLVRDTHTTSTSHGTGSNTLMICKPLGRDRHHHCNE